MSNKVIAMGITVISGANLSTPGNAASTQAAADSSGAANFFALLTQQMSGASLADLQLPTAGLDALKAMKGLATDASKDGAKVQDDDSQVQDPASALAAAGLLPALLAGTNQPHAAANNVLSQQGSHEIGGIIGQLGQASDTGALLGTADSATTVGGAGRDDTANLAADTELTAATPSNFAATLAAQTSVASQQVQGHSEASATPQINTPLQDGRWAQDFGQKIVWLAKNDQQVAQISLNPPELGPMHITLNLSGDQASAAFVSPHAEVRQAIEDAMPRLREMLAGAGIDLGQSSVGTQLPQNGSQPQFSASSRSADDNAILRADNESGSAVPTAAAVRSGRSMVDLFA